MKEKLRDYLPAAGWIIAIILAVYGPYVSLLIRYEKEQKQILQGDLNKDETVDAQDFSILMDNWKGDNKVQCTVTNNITY